MDARRTNIEDASIDFFYSNNTLEHIPKDIIVPILKECRRILRTDGVFSVRTDYSDHWSHFDKSISTYNYTTFSEKEWQRYNPSLHYQNRLRHSDYLRCFEDAGFDVLETELFYPNQSEIEILKDLPLADEFKHYSFDDLSIVGSWLIGRKK